jgi:very-short-patch-repair endonuclease
MLRLLVTQAGFPEPEVNGVIVNSLGAPIAHGDLVFRGFRTILEYDGGHHREDERQFNVDIDRLDQLMEEEWRVIRVNKSLMSRRATLIGKIETALRRGGWRPATK